MATQLNDLVGNLEQRIADRTRAIQASAEVSRRLSTILDPRQLTRGVVEQIQQTFNYYHVHIYLFNDTHTDLLLAWGSGDAGRAMLARNTRSGPGLVDGQRLECACAGCRCFTRSRLAVQSLVARNQDRIGGPDCHWR
jgi:GAF domain-containing protein